MRPRKPCHRSGHSPHVQAAANFLYNHDNCYQHVGIDLVFCSSLLRASDIAAVVDVDGIIM